VAFRANQKEVRHGQDHFLANEPAPDRPNCCSKIIFSRLLSALAPEGLKREKNLRETAGNFREVLAGKNLRETVKLLDFVGSFLLSFKSVVDIDMASSPRRLIIFAYVG
jgi:hypothetical protein